MDFKGVFRLLLSSFEKENIDCALIGGFALHVAGYTRATQDIDFLVKKEDAPKVKDILSSFGYECLFESEDIAQYRGKMKELGRVDFLLAHRTYAKRMLGTAIKADILDGQFQVKVVLPEDMIGLKVQSSSNQPERYHQDMADIECILRASAGKVNMEQVKEYFQIFDRRKDLDDILGRLKYA